MTKPQTEKPQTEKIKMANVRLSFPSLFQTEVFGGDDTGKYAATFILDKKEHADVIKTINAQIAAITKDRFKGKALAPDRVCLKDGNDSDRDDYADKMTIKAATKKRPLVINRDKTPLNESDEVIYAGCYVNAIISLWAQDNQFGKRINASLEGVQFAGHGEPFGSGGIDANEFDMFETEEEMPF